jgi:hypothetical protein
MAGSGKKDEWLKASSPFLKKRTKKLLLLGSGGRFSSPCKKLQAFFAADGPLAAWS